MESFLQFKDYLSINTDRLKKKYNTLKQELAERYATDRRAYHQGKTRFMQKYYGRSYRLFHTGSRDYSSAGWKNNKAENTLRGYNKEYFEKQIKTNCIRI